MHDGPSHGDDPPTGLLAGNDAGAAPDAGAVVEQVRELLFGDQRRAADSALKALEERLAALTAAIEARFGEFERKIEDLKAQMEKAQGAQARTIGAALVELGESLRADLAKPDGKSQKT